MQNNTFQLYTDGGARGNPGPAAYGFTILSADGSIVEDGAEFLGIMTNNQAEYAGLIAGLKVCLAHNIANLDCFMDSELIVKQVKGEYKVKDEKMKAYFDQVQKLLGQFEQISFTHIKRALNKYADSLVNKVLDENT